MKPGTQCIPVKPVLKSIVNNDRGGISIDRNDTELLMIYVNELQHCAGVK
jgi:hypothetical protein